MVVNFCLESKTKRNKRNRIEFVSSFQRVRPNEQLVVYRLGRVQTPARRQGFTFVLPFLDFTKRIRTKQNNLPINSTQVNFFSSSTEKTKIFRFVFSSKILCRDNAIIDVNVCVEYNIDDPILVSNSLNDIEISLKSLTRSLLVQFVAKIDGMKIEQQIYDIELSLKNELNRFVRKWGIEIGKINL